MGGRTKQELDQLADQLIVEIQKVGQDAENLLTDARDMKAALEAGRDVFVSPVIGAGKSFYNAKDLAADQMAELELAVHAGHSVLVILDMQGGRYHIARVLSMVGRTVTVVVWGADENKPESRKVLANPEHEIWGWYIAPIVDGI